MQICLLSMFSTSAMTLGQYFDQVSVLSGVLASRGDHLRLILCEGDSTDDTWTQLHDRVADHQIPTWLVQMHHGNTVYGSVEHPQRFAQLSRIWNAMLARVRYTDDVVVIVESDLIWDSDTLLGLIDLATIHGAVFAPLVLVGDVYFHDVWAYRRRGRHFDNWPPYHPDLAGPGLLELDSAGSCLVMPGQVARTIRTTEQEELVGFCRECRKAGWPIYLDASRRIAHPPEPISAIRIARREVQEIAEIGSRLHP